MTIFTIIGIIILAILGLLLFLNWDCIMEGLNRESKAFCLKPDYGLGQLTGNGTPSENEECRCFTL